MLKYQLHAGELAIPLILQTFQDNDKQTETSVY